MALSGVDFSESIKIKGVDFAFGELIAEYDSWVTSHIVRYLGWKNCPFPELDCEDVRQLTWKAVYLDIEKYHRGEKSSDYSNTQGWLFRIQRRFCIQDILRHIQEDSHFTRLDDSAYLISDNSQFTTFPFLHSPVESKHYAEEVRDFVRKFFFNLPKEQKIVFELFINGFTHKEIAFFLNITPERSRQWVSRAARKIKKRLC